MSYYQSLQNELEVCSLPIAERAVPAAPHCIVLRSLQIGTEQKDAVIRLVSCGAKIQSACNLINDRYAWRGYGAHHQIPLDQNHITFTAEIDGEVLGTITLALDSRHGMAADRAHKDQIDEIRSLPRTTVCELTKFAFDPSIQSKELMAALFHTVFVYGVRTYNCTDLFVEVVARHVRFYEAMLGFKRIGDLKMNETVQKPVQLMWLKVSAIRNYIDQLANSSAPMSARSLYPFFFSPDRENAIYRSLMRQTELVEGSDPLSVPRRFDAPARRGRTLPRLPAGAVQIDA